MESDWRAPPRRSAVDCSASSTCIASRCTRGPGGAAALRDSETPKAIRIEVVYDGSLPDQIPGAWQGELLPVLDPRQQEKLRDAYAQLKPNDWVSIDYVPSRGTTVTVLGERVLVDRGQELMGAFLDLWVGQTPVSEEMKQELLQQLR
jgi:hypothetical protein